MIFMLSTLYVWRESPWYPLDRELGGPKIHRSTTVKRNKICCCRELNQSFNLEPVTLFTELFLFVNDWQYVDINNLIS